ncbi:hypothetical protein [Capillimicrobium parvum]|uniref:Hydrogenase maturation protease n=1 Tax=Capillimicrobium parvum TaxID=2884022 RepID=A0A9E6XYW8_9ACTN|nr:hypothetical protein [Capillimicrobium parvum]UGS37010.1 hypothetical protein DSM104329_03422 [Capillimicrobium parvum]
MTEDPVRRIADAVLYEGYVLWPYRRSALKNQRRWTFGGVHPRAHSERHPDDRWLQRTECLVEQDRPPDIDVRVRFLHVVRRDVARDDGGGRLVDVDELTVAGRRHLAWDEAAEREIGAPGAVSIAAGVEEEPLLDEDGTRAGALIRRWEGLTGSVGVDVAPVGDGLWRVTVAVANTTPFAGCDREAALRRTFCSTHAVLRTRTGRFVSLTDPPPALAGVAATCRNEGVWPVLIGDDRTVLSSPIILEDHPRIAPESPGDLFDGGEIDQLLILSILGLTDAEKAEMRDSDPRAAEILARCEALEPEQLMRLHGMVRPA